MKTQETETFCTPLTWIRERMDDHKRWQMREIAKESSAIEREIIEQAITSQKVFRSKL